VSFRFSFQLSRPECSNNPCSDRTRIGFTGNVVITYLVLYEVLLVMNNGEVRIVI